VNRKLGAVRESVAGPRSSALRRGQAVEAARPRGGRHRGSAAARCVIENFQCGCRGTDIQSRMISASATIAIHERLIAVMMRISHYK
jgi:hypothetical protein